MEDAVRELLDAADIENKNVDALLYPNAVNYIARLSLHGSPAKRTTTRASLLKFLASERRAAISKWTLGLKTKDQLLKHRKKQLKQGLSQNVRERHLHLSRKALADFDDGIVLFIEDFVGRYHYKVAHTRTPLVVLDCDTNTFDDICGRLHKKSIQFSHGYPYPSGDFDGDHLMRDPIRKGRSNVDLQREFVVRIARHETARELLATLAPHDLFVVTHDSKSASKPQDTNVELLGVTNFTELRFILGLSDVYA